MNEQTPFSQSILALLHNTTALSTINAVSNFLQGLNRMLSPSDGLKWFNLLYLQVTQALDQQPASTWQNPDWLKQLDVNFAKLYFDALTNECTDQTKVPQAWMALFDARDNRYIERVQFALAGMNAHINHDLPLALVQTGQDLQTPPYRNRPEYGDFEKVNNVINSVMPQTLEELKKGILGQIAQDTDRLAHLLAIWSVATARDTAWTNAEILWELQGSPEGRANVLKVLDRMTGLASRGLLTVV